MSIDLINNVLEKLKEKTGREWSLVDLMQLAQKLPDLNSGSIDAVIQELNDMGVDLPENAKEKVMKKLDENPNFSLEDIGNLSNIQDAREVKQTSRTSSTKKKTKPTGTKKISQASSKKGLYDRVQKLQATTKKRKKK